MKKLLFRVREYLWYVLKARHRHGFGVHSPFAYDVITKVFEEKSSYYIYNDVEKERRRLLHDRTSIFFDDYGTGKSGERRICDIARKALKNASDAQLIFRTALFQKPKTVIELGTSLGLTTAYLSKAAGSGKCHTFDGCGEVVDFAKQVASNCGTAASTVFHVGDIAESLPLVIKDMESVDVVFMDANHTKEATLAYYSIIKPKLSNGSVLIMDDIHSSKGMRDAWNEIRQDEKARVSFDMYGLGVIYYNEKLSRKDYIYYRD